MNICPNCGAPLTDGAQLCSNCGASTAPAVEEQLITGTAGLDVVLGLLTAAGCVGLFFLPLLIFPDRSFLPYLLLLVAGFFGPIPVWMLYLKFRERRPAFATGLKYGFYMQILVLCGALAVCLTQWR